MRFLCSYVGSLLAVAGAFGATIGTVVPITGGASDLVIDEPRGRVYLPNTNTNRLEVYSIPQRRFLNSIAVEQQPLAAAMSRNGASLYVTCNAASSLVEIDLDTLAVKNRVSLPARPEGVAVGGDGRVLISTVGTGQNNLLNVLLIYDPFAETGSQSISAVPVSPPPPANPLLPPNNFGRGGLINRSFLETSRDGRFIIGMNVPNAQARAVFVYEVESGTVLRSRTVQGVSSVLSVSPEGSKFMAGLTLFDTATLTVLAQQNAANAPHPFPPGSNFNLQQNQGGSAFTTDGARIYGAFNFIPVTNPPSRPNVSQLMISDPENLLIEGALQLPENIAGKMDLTEDNGTLFALSESGLMIVPLSQLNDNPVAALDAPVRLINNDQCGVTGDSRLANVAIRNIGRGRITANAQVLQQAPVGPGGLGGAAGPGGGIPGGVIIIIPPVPAPGGGGAGGQGGGGGGGAGQPPNPGGAVLPGGAATNANNNVFLTAPRMRTQNMPDGVNFEFSYNPINRSLGTVSPTHQYVVSSPEAVNIPPLVRVFQNNRNAESRGDIMPVEVGTSANEGLFDMLLDQPRQRLYIANSGKNRIEVFDTRNRVFQEPIKVGQLPHSMAFSVDGLYMYVANNGSESISIVDLDTRQTVGRVRFPATPFNNNTALIRPELVATTTRGPLVLMSDGTLWRVVGDEAVPRLFNTNVIPTTNGRQVIAGPVRSMTSAPGGEVVLLLAGNGFAYLYDANADDFVATRQVVTPPINGYYGPVSVGPRGQYFLVNGFVLNQSLTQIGTAGTAPAPQQRPGQPPLTVNRPVAAVAAVSNTSFARFVQPVIATPNVLLQGLSDTANIEIVEVTTGRILGAAATLERPLSTPTGNQRANVAGRTLVADMANNTGYVLTTSGLSLVPLDQVPPQNRPLVNPQGGVTNSGTGTAAIAQGGLIHINGRALAATAEAPRTGPAATVLGGSCVTINNVPLPLLASSNGRISAQIPPELAAGRYTLTVRSLDGKAASNPAPLTVSKYAPAVMFDAESNRAQVFHGSDGKPVTKANPAKRDRPLYMFAVGLGPTKGGRVVAGQPAPAEPLAVTDDVDVFFGDARLSYSPVIVDWSGLEPGFIGLYRLNLRVPGVHGRGDALPVTLRIGGVSSPSTNAPVVAVD